MEQTVNLFTKGLQMDTNPMIQGSDTLTDALNATLVTMNGNEVILQNDMGNRRVDNAFLPPGYEPVGMKEYGGIIYVASYNPVTHHSQIGSFPSPERKLDVENPNSDYGTRIFDFGVESGYLTETTKLIPLTKDKVLHAGDKFMIYGENSSNGELTSNNITNWNNINNPDDKKAKSPKNRKYTLSIGVLNSLNEFVDITKDLVRIDSNGNIISFDENDSEIYKFNSGYFLKTSNTNNNPFNTTAINDNNLILERQRFEANTYSYKLVGPLYLKVLLNIPTTFNYNIYGIKEGSLTKLTVEGYFTYNCPDGVSSSSSTGNENYSTFDTGRVLPFTTFCDFNMDGSIIGSSNPSIDVKYDSSIEDSNGISSYDPVSNLYSVKIVKSYIVEATTGMLNYNIKVGETTSLTTNEQTVFSHRYIKNLSVENETLDLDKLNSGEVELTAWRFFNDFENLNTTLTYSFKAYPKYGEKYSGLVLAFRDITNNTDLTEFPNNPTYTNLILWLNTNRICYFANPKELNNGRTTINFNWNELGLEPRKIYKVEWGYKVISLSSLDGWDWNNDKRWFITTELYNNHYSVYSDEFWDDYCYDDDLIDTENNPSTNPDGFRKIDLNVPIGIEKHIEDHSTLSEPEYENSMFGPEELIKFSCKYTYNLNIIDKSLYYIKDINLYPDFILLKSGIYPKIDSENTGIIAVGNYILQSGDLIPNIFNARVEKYLSSTFTGLNLDTFLDNPNISCLDKSITGTINYYDRYRSEGEIISKISNAFAKVGDVADLLFEISNNGACGIFADGCAEDGSRDEHYLHVFSGLTVDHDVRNELNNGVINHHIDNYSTEPSNHSYLPEGANRIRERSHEGTVIFKVRDDEEQIFSYFNNDLNKDLIITYMFPLLFNNANDSDSTHTAPDELEYYKRNSTERERPSNSPVVGKYSRCWWRTNDGSWALVNELIPKLLNIVTYLEDLPQNLAYIAAHDISFNTNETVVITRALDVQQNERLPINIIITCPYSVVDINNFKKYININVKYGAFYHITGTNLIHFEIENTTKLIVITLLPGLYKNGSGEINRKQILSFELKNIIFTENSINSNIMESTLPLWFTSQLLSNQEEYSIYTSMFNENYYYCAYNEYNYSSDGKYLPIYKSSDKKTYNEKINDSLLLSIKYIKEDSSEVLPVLPVSPTGSLSYHEMIEIDPTIALSMVAEPETIDEEPTITESETSNNSEENNSGTRRLRSEDPYKLYLKSIEGYNNFNDFVNVEVNNENIENTQGIWINLVSGQDFRDKIMQDINPSNIILDTGEMLDSSGKELNLNYLYYRSGGKLISKPTKSVFIDRENTKATVNGDLNLLLYNRINRTLPLYRYNAIWELQEHTFTLLDFSGLNIVEKI